MLFYLLCTALIVVGVAWMMGFFSGVAGPSVGSQKGATRISAPSSQDRKEMMVLFGSQTGTAEMFAKTLVREGARLGVPIKLSDIENYEPDNLEFERLVVILCATYGEGEPTDSMKDFHDWLFDDSRQLNEELRAVQYAVFGLGDRQYKYFCEEGISVDRRLAELGARRVYGLGCGDSGQNIEEDFDAWRRDLWPAVGRVLGVQLRKEMEEPVEPECRMRIWDEPEAPLPFPKVASVLEPTQRLPAWIPVVRNEELLRGIADSRSTRHVEFDISGTIISYQGGDHLGILPCNTDATVNAYLRILGISEEEAQQVFSLQDRKTGKSVFPARVSVRTAFKWYLDLDGPPKKSILRAFAHCCKDPSERMDMLRILRVNPESSKEYTKLAGKLRNVHGFLRKYKSASIPLAFFLEMMPRIAPRYFSISSDLLSHPKQLSITAAIVDGGLCTGMLRNLEVGQRIPAYVRKSNFHLPLKAKERPIVMIGPGTGVAPLIGFLHRRTAWLQKGHAIGKSILFFGCRRRDEDHIYSNFMTECINNHTLTVLDVAYSREQEKKVYVQHHVADRAKEVWEILRDGGNLYLCGDAKYMAKDVEKELLALLQSEGGMSASDAEEYLKKMDKEGKYFKDVWSAS